MRKSLLVTLFLALGTSLSAPAFATDSSDAAFELLSNFKTEKKEKHFIKINRSLDKSEAMAVDAKLTEIYGEPKTNRRGLKVWEVENTSGSRAKKTTIMCGPDGQGGVYISADRRGPKKNGAATRSKRMEKAKAEKRANTRASSRPRRHSNAPEL